MSKIDLWNKNRVMAIIRGVQPTEAVSVAQAMFDAGVRVIEVPLNSPSPFESIASIAEKLGDRMLVGAGTVLTSESVQELKAAGGEFVVSPNLDRQVIQATKRADLLSYPGVMTVTECFEAIEAGADGLKLFPACAIGKEFIRAIKAVLPKNVPIIAVGGVDEHTIHDWRDSGADGFALGSALYKPGMANEEVSQRCKAILSKLAFGSAQERD